MYIHISLSVYIYIYIYPPVTPVARPTSFRHNDNGIIVASTSARWQGDNVTCWQCGTVKCDKLCNMKDEVSQETQTWVVDTALNKHCFLRL